MNVKKFVSPLTPLVFLGPLLTSGTVQATCSDNPYMGSICMTAANFCPRGYFPTQGQLLEISQYTALFSLLGTNYGGDGRTTFGLPDLRSRLPVGIGTGPGLSDIRLGQQGGKEYQTLTLSQLPSHNHNSSFTTDVSTTPTVDVTIPLSTDKGISESPQSGENSLYTVSKSALAVNANAKLYGDAINDSQPDSYLSGKGTITQPMAVTGSIGNTGGSQSFSTRDPYLGLTYCIAIQGLYPSRN